MSLVSGAFGSGFIEPPGSDRASGRIRLHNRWQADIPMAMVRFVQLVMGAATVATPVMLNIA